MQEKVTGDALLARDIEYVVPVGGRVLRGRAAEAGTSIEVYAAYPSVALPRFLVPVRDTAAQRFVLTMMSADKGLVGVLLRVLLAMPGGTTLAFAAIFRERVAIQHHE